MKTASLDDTVVHVSNAANSHGNTMTKEEETKQQNLLNFSSEDAIIQGNK